MNSLSLLYTKDELREMLKKAISARVLLSENGGIQEVRQGDRNTRFHPGNIGALESWIVELEIALEFRASRRTSRPVHF